VKKEAHFYNLNGLSCPNLREPTVMFWKSLPPFSLEEKAPDFIKSCPGEKAVLSADATFSVSEIRTLHPLCRRASWKRGV